MPLAYYTPLKNYTWQHKSEMGASSIIPMTESPDLQLPNEGVPSAFNKQSILVQERNIDGVEKDSTAAAAGAKYVPFFGGAVDQDLINSNICKKKECLANDNPHRHNVVSV